jgi:hypothetical protein
VINVAYGDEREALEREFRNFRYLFVNTESMPHYMGTESDLGWLSRVIPHHHCNEAGFFLPEARIDKPKVVGYLGEKVHLHDHDVIADAVGKMGMTFLCADSNDLSAYQRMDIGIAWTRRDERRDATRSNIKLTNFAAHGIPSVACNYESYREVNRTVGDVGLIRGELSDFIEGIDQLCQDRDLRHALAANGKTAQTKYARFSIAGLYRDALTDFRKDWEG